MGLLEAFQLRNALAQTIEAQASARSGFSAREELGGHEFLPAAFTAAAPDSAALLYALEPDNEEAAEMDAASNFDFGFLLGERYFPKHPVQRLHGTRRPSKKKS